MQAKKLGLRWLEFDVMLSKDEEVVVIHDETLERTTNGTGFVADSSYAYLKTLDAGSWFAPMFAGQRIPLLAEVIQFMHVNQMTANIEIKAVVGSEAIAAKKVLAVIQAEWQAGMAPPLISSFSLTILREIRKLDQTCHIGLLMHEWLADWEQICDELHCVSVQVNQAILTAARVAEIKASQRLVLSYTVNDSVCAQKLFSWGVAAVYSDCPDRIR